MVFLFASWVRLFYAQSASAGAIPCRRRSAADENEETLASVVLFLRWRETPMLASGKMVGFVLTTDYDKARAFYEGRLGGEFVSQDPFALAVRIGGHQIRIGKVPEFTPARNTVLGWEVEDIESATAWLQGQGVELEKYPFIQDKERGIWTAPTGDKVAWFRDPDGNVLSVSQHVH